MSCSVSTIQSTPKPEYSNQATRKKRDGFDRCHSRHRTGLPSSDGPGSQGARQAREVGTRNDCGVDRDPDRPACFMATPRIRKVASPASNPETTRQPANNPR